MSGDNQHFIPQSTLRGFKIPGSGKKGSVWCYEAGQAPRRRSIKRIGAGDKFYSHPTSAVPDLDDRITRYENRLAPLQQQLRDLSVGSMAPAAVAAEVVAHLTIRTAHTRQTFAMGAKYMMSRAIAIFSDRKSLEKLVGLENGLPGATLRAKLAQSLAENPRFKSARLPPQALERIVILFLKERLPNGLPDDALVFVPGVMGQALLSADRWVADGHSKAMEQSFSATERVKHLETLQWSVEAPFEEAILPDCVALAIAKNGEFQPLVLAENEEIEAIVMPLSPAQLLVGRVDPSSQLNLTHLNLFAASCSQEFFVAATHSPELARWATVIGGGSWSALSKSIEAVFDEYAIESPPPTETPAPGPEPKPEPETERFPTGEIRYGVSFLGCADEAVAQEVADIVKHVVSAIGRVVPLNRLDGITFAEDYEGALRDLDRGFKTSTPLTTTDEPGAVGMAMSPTVCRDGVAKTRILVRAQIAHGLLSEDKSLRDHCIYILADRLVAAGSEELFDVALPGILFSKIERRFDSVRYEIVATSWGAYIGARVCAPIFPEVREMYVDLLMNALDRAQRELPEIRLGYRFHGDLDKLMKAATSEVERILQHAASLIGHADGIEEPSCAAGSELEALLTRMNLGPWFDWYQRDLRKMYERRGRWETFNEFLSLGEHAERILIQFGMFLWEGADGNCGVAIPIISDAARLPVASLRRPHLFLGLVARNLYGAIKRRL